MFAGRFKTVIDYFEDIRRLVINSGLIENWSEMKLHANNKREGIVRCNDPLVFMDGARLRFTEDVEIDGYTRGIERAHYSYHYEQNNGYYFRYERDQPRSREPDGTLIVNHPELHLHVFRDSPRYMTHKTSFEEVFIFIHACFYRQEAG